MADDTPTDTPSGGAPTPGARDYRYIFGTRARTSTVSMIVAFIGLLMLFGYTTDYYATLDAENEPVQVRRPAATRVTSEYSEKPSSTPSRVTTTAPQVTGDADSSDSSSTPSTSSTSAGVPLPSWLVPRSTGEQSPQSQVPQR